ncbi:hypothetical protein AIIKEEIJ_01670 [Rhodococcus sp. YH1]|nr:hypothetical protein [Rhodococcus sp. YH1]
MTGPFRGIVFALPPALLLWAPIVAALALFFAWIP